MKLSNYLKLKRKLESKNANVAVIGLGYVGLPYAVAFAEAGYNVHGIDLDKNKVNLIRRGKSYIIDIDSNRLKNVIKNNKLTVHSDYNIISDIDAVVVCVPTPLNKTRDPELSFIISAFTNIRKKMRQGQLYILSSTTYPGTTVELVYPILDKSGFKVGEDYFLSFSPERIDPGNKLYMLKDITKVIGGMTPKCSALSKILFKPIVKDVFLVKDTKTAEMVKLLENTFRSINIAFVNELAIMCSRLGINIWEVIKAASTKPYGFMPFYPGPGMGGHCIPIDPLYLSWKMKILNYRARFIELAEEINRDMPYFVVEKIGNVLNEQGKPLKDSRVCILGVTYKKDVSDVRESPAIEIIKLLQERGANVSYVDPYVQDLSEDGVMIRSKRLTADFLKTQDCVVIITDHNVFNWEWIIKNSKRVIDFRNATEKIKDNRDKISLL